MLARVMSLRKKMASAVPVKICFSAVRKISKDVFGSLTYLFCSTNPLDLFRYRIEDTQQMSDLPIVTWGRNCQTSSNCSQIYPAFKAIIPSRKGISLLGHQILDTERSNGYLGQLPHIHTSQQQSKREPFFRKTQFCTQKHER